MPEPMRMFKTFMCRQCFRDFNGEEVLTCPKCNPQWGQCLECGFLEGRGHSTFCEAKPDGSCEGCGMEGGRHREHCIAELGRRMAYNREKAMLEAILGPLDRTNVREVLGLKDESVRSVLGPPTNELDILDRAKGTKNT